MMSLVSRLVALGFPALAALIFLNAACSAPAAVTAPETPVGVWRSADGAFVEITNDLRYRFCDGSACMTGVARKHGVMGIVLLGFLDHPVTARVRRESGFEKSNSLRGDMFRQEHDYDFTDNIGDEEFRRRRCDGRPCHHMGERDLYDFTFVKQP